MVNDVAHETDQVAVMERRRNRVEIHDVLAALVGIVRDDHVTRLQLLGTIMGDELAHHDLEAREHHRVVMSLGQRLPRGVRDHTGHILDLCNDSGASRAHDRVTHFIGHLLQCIADDLHGDHIGHDPGTPLVFVNSTSNPKSTSTWARVCGGMTVAEVSSSMTAGPSMIIPGRRRSRS